MGNGFVLYGVKDPDGKLIDIQPQYRPEFVMDTLTTKLVREKRSNEALKSGNDLVSVCWRANNNQFNWKYNLPNEIGRLMGYKVIPVTVSEATEDIEQ